MSHPVSKRERQRNSKRERGAYELGFNVSMWIVAIVIAIVAVFFYYYIVALVVVIMAVVVVVLVVVGLSY